MHPQIYNWKRLLKAGPMLGLAFTLAGHAQSTQEDQGRVTLQRACTTCHNINVVTSHRLNKAGWQNVVENMISRGAQATPDEQEQIVRYLTANFGVGTAAPKDAASGEEAAESGAAPVAPPVPPAPVLTYAQIARAKQLISSNGCMSCHRLNGEGSFAGPYLGDAGAKAGPTRIRAALVSPSKDVAPENRSVRVTTHDGKTLVGKLLNQDAFTVQFIDASGQLMSLDKADLQEFSIITANPMPSFASQLTPQDLSLLVQYLDTLRGTSLQQ